MKILIAAGGTGGHIFPGLAVAKALQQQGNEIVWMGAAQGLEAKLVPAAGIRLCTIKISGLRGKGVKRLLTAPIKISQAVCQAKRIMKQEKPDVILGMGGYVSGPAGLAAWLQRKPLIIHEQNAIAGMTNRWLARVATQVLESFPHTFTNSKKVIYTGNPVRAEINAINKANELNHEHRPLHILILGGSLGAHAINQIVPAALQLFSPVTRPAVWHQTGEADQSAVKQAYQQAGIEATVDAFITDMAAAYHWADLVICRAGATTVAELSAAGIPAIMIPLPHAVDDHQTANAKSLANIGAGIILPQSQLSAAALYAEITNLNQPQKLQHMAQQALTNSRKDAVELIVNACQGVVTE
jgi:UDP-N-acetylglucosamine--N-acetylmuramyl-(pentapeptide) pyrophosphoryl-undecaprenol N-acetylglucosamine transferase